MLWCVNGKYYWSISLGNIKRLRSVHVFVNYKSSDKPLKDLPPVRPYLADFTSHYLQTSRECFSLTRDFPMSRHFFLLWFFKQTNPRKMKQKKWLIGVLISLVLTSLLCNSSQFRCPASRQHKSLKVCYYSPDRKEAGHDITLKSLLYLLPTIFLCHLEAPGPSLTPLFVIKRKQKVTTILTFSCINKPTQQSIYMRRSKTIIMSDISHRKATCEGFCPINYLDNNTILITSLRVWRSIQERWSSQAFCLTFGRHVFLVVSGLMNDNGKSGQTDLRPGREYLRQISERNS